MHSLLALTVIALTACAIAHPPVREGQNDFSLNGLQALVPPNRKSIRDYLLPRYMRKNEDSARVQSPRPQMPASDWLNEEIDRIKRMQDLAPQLEQYQSELPGWTMHEPFKRVFGPNGRYGTRSHVSPYFEYTQLLPPKSLLAATVPRKHAKVLHHPINTMIEDEEIIQSQDAKKIFAFTPFDSGYFGLSDMDKSSQNASNEIPEGLHEGGGHENLEDLGPRRQIRQNPISRTKNLVAEDVDKLRAGVEDSGGFKDKPVRVFGSEFASGTIYAVAIAASAGTAAILAIVGFAIGWYTLSKRAKAAADVDYPAYGVTGPTMDTSGDRKLAHSAQMYHYQHQKQQIIAMERNNEEQRNGSISDPESDEENEEGDYTVYECPGFATTGDMEVKNPLFNEEATPATPGKVELVKPQLKE